MQPLPDGGDGLLAATGIRLAPTSPPIDLAIRPGEIVGLAGLEGHGQEAFLETLCGLRRPASGSVTIRDGARPVTVDGHAGAARQGIAYLPRDRRATGILPGQSVFDNFAIATLQRHAWFGLVPRRPLHQRLAAFRDRLSIVFGDSGAAIGTLSGGNQQKVLLARWLACEPRILLMNDPTRGVDMGTRLKLYDVFRSLAREDGIPIVLLSSEIEEVLQLCDRVLVFREQAIARELPQRDLSMDRVIAAMFGQAEGR